MKKRILSIVLTLCMALSFVPTTAFADGGTDSTPSVSAYATKEQMMDGTFAPNENGAATNYGKVVFGKKKNSDNTYSTLEWYILGKDTGVSGDDNTIIFAASPIATNQSFNSSTSNKTYSYEAGTGYGNNTGSIAVYPNHYGASELRTALRGMASNSDYFTTAEQGLMNPTTVTTNDTLNNVPYTTTDKLYALQEGADHTKLRAGSDDRTVLYRSSYWNSVGAFWMRTPYVNIQYPTDNHKFAMITTPSSDAIQTSIGGRVSAEFAVQPASNLNLSSVLFASAATAASSDTVLSTITSGAAMTLRLDGSNKNIGTVSYKTATGDIKITRGSTEGNVALVVQGRGTVGGEEKDWYYSKKITGTETVNVSDIAAESNTPASINLSSCKIWLETTGTDGMIYAVDKEISTVEITGIDAPSPNNALDTEASCVTAGVSSTTPQVTWTPNDSKAGYNTSYTASITLTADTGYKFADTVTATVLGNTATSVTKNADGTLTVTYVFSATAKDRLTSITAPQAITAANGTAYSDMNLPEQVNIVTEGNTVTSAPVTWNTTTPASGSYDPAVLTEQTVTLNGTVACPDSIDDNGVSLTTNITITISAADIVEAPTASPAAGTYSENQSVTLTSSTEGATIYYTTDGSEPTVTGGVPEGTTVEYTAPVAVTGSAGQSVQTTIKAIAVKSGMQDSSVEAFIYTIQLPGSIHYDILDGADSNWTLNSNVSLSFRGSGEYSKFVGVKVDGTLVDAKNYTVKEGSTIITLKADYLNTLSVGTHTFEIVWTDGSASTVFTIKEDTSGNVESPQTGDDTSGVWLFVLSIISGTGLILTAKKRRKNLKISVK